MAVIVGFKVGSAEGVSVGFPVGPEGVAVTWIDGWAVESIDGMGGHTSVDVKFKVTKPGGDSTTVPIAVSPQLMII